MNMQNETGGEERFRQEKAKGRKLRQSQWWKGKIAKGICNYCGGKFDPADLSMDHIVHTVPVGYSCLPGRG